MSAEQAIETPVAASPAVEASAPNNTAAETGVAAAAASPDVDGAHADDSGAADPKASLTVRALVSTKEAGIIIGKGGANVAELREKTGVKAGVSKVVPGVHDRVLSVSGSLEGIAEAFSLIGKTILENPLNPNAEVAANQSGSPLTSVRLLISHNLMGTVIGRQGLKIKHIQDLSGARMVASKEMLPQSTERVVEVQGTVEAIRVAIFEIAKCLAEDWERAQGVVLYHPGQTEGAGVLAAGGAGGLQQQGGRRNNHGNGSGSNGSNGPAYLSNAVGNLNLGGNRREGGSGARRTDPNAAVTPGGGLVAGTTPASANGGSQAASAPPLVDSANLRTQNISIPSDMVGCIIGKGGSKITEIRRLSGSRISIAKIPHDETGERMFTIQGTPEANEKALFLLYNQLETEKERRTNNTAASTGSQDEAPAAAATSA
ncbi:RNA binding protein, heterogenous nuclear RNP-K like protein [Thecaphora frezii]